jgi:TonB family protein
MTRAEGPIYSFAKLTRQPTTLLPLSLSASYTANQMRIPKLAYATLLVAFMPTPTFQAQTASVAGDGFVGPIVTHTAKYDPKDEAGRPIAPATPVIVGIVVDEKGNPQNVHVIRSSGTQEADAASLKTVSEYRFKPARDHDHPVSVALYIELSPREEPLFSTKWDPAAIVKPHRNVKPPVLIKSEEAVLSEGKNFCNNSVVVGMVIDRTGIPTNLKIIQSCGDTGIDQSALDAASKYRFGPATEDNQPVAVELRVTINFAFK